MKLDTTELPKAMITSNSPLKKLTVYQFLWTNTNAVEEAGLGPRTITVIGLCDGSTERDAIEQVCEAEGEKLLYFPSAIGQTDDRYYKVKTHPAVLEPPGQANPSQYTYTIECICEEGSVYDTATGLAVW